ncbi:MAG: hypothetical protein LC650_00450 [Actinobacteria bacterium]|nr:hypothetical protein [Actinomycetota bacterium]
MTNTYPTPYNLQKLRKELKGFSKEQLEHRLWWTHLSPAWDKWTLEELQRLFDTAQKNP